MSVWDGYLERTSLKGTMRDAAINKAKDSISRMIFDSPSCKHVLINGNPQYVSLSHKQDMNEKKICSIPGESIPLGGIVDFLDTKWLIIDIETDNEIYDKGLMRKCNHLLKWIGHDGLIKEKWCVVKDGTNYVSGEQIRQTITVGDARIMVIISKDEDTLRFKRGMRFIIDDPDAESPVVYEITKSDKTYRVHDGNAVYRFVLSETQLTDNDNVELGIADYSSWKPPKRTDGDHVDSDLSIDEIVERAIEDDVHDSTGIKKGWI